MMVICMSLAHKQNESSKIQGTFGEEWGESVVISRVSKWAPLRRRKVDREGLRKKKWKCGRGENCWCWLLWVELHPACLDNPIDRGAWQATVHGDARVRHDLLHCLSHIYMCARSLSHVQLFVTPRALAHQALLSMEFSKQVHWSGLPFPSPGDLLDSGNEHVSLVLPALVGNFFFLPLVPPGKPIYIRYIEVLIPSTSECDLIWK